MAFGWKTEYEKSISTEGLSNWEVFAIAERACKQLGWEYLIVDETTFTATTPTNWTLTEEIIRIVVKEENIVFNSQSESIELYEAGRNQNNIEEELLPAFRKTKWALKPEDLQLAAGALKEETLKQLKSGNRLSSEKITYGFKDHEITFLLIAVNILLFAAMVLKGADIYEPGVSDIIYWGGSVKGYVTGGEWWRLTTALFIHIGIYPLLANMAGLYLIGILVESMLGKLKFLIAYLCAGTLAGLVSMLWLPAGVTAGASGAIFGLYGVLFAFSTTNYINKKFPWFWLACISAYAAFNVVLGLYGAADNAANIGGLLCGIVIGYLFYFFHFYKNLARSGGTRISVEIILVTALILYFYLRGGADDSLKFQQSVMKLNQIELKAMQQMQHMAEKTDEQATKFLRDTALPEWKHFRTEIIKTDVYRLNKELRQKRYLLSKYADLRVKQTELIYKSLAGHTDKYNKEINDVSDKIDGIIDQLADDNEGM